ncbi:MAG: polynucleotide adenylyltransferase [Sphingomonas sp.]|nr:polynucleotide adenylyltransferase [Sphingomonas sp.]
MSSVTLPHAPWRERTGLNALCDALGAAAGGARFVGGIVRDTLIGIDAHDIDIATRLPPDDVMARLRAAGIKAVPTGIAHGTITAILPDGPVEVTTLRRDVATDGRHATIAFSDDWREDAARRDFTINALYADPASGAVFDYFGGLSDLAARHVRFIGDPLKRIAEDHLRILRFFRFLARFGDAPDVDGLAACAARANDLMALSRERIADELLKLLVTDRAPDTAALMIAKGIFVPVLPEVTSADRLGRVAAVESAAGLAPDPVRRLAALLPDDPVLGDQLGARLKLSNVQRKRLSSALTPETGAPHALGYRLGLEGARDRLALHLPLAEAIGAIAVLRDWHAPRLGVSGGSLVTMGLSRGPDVARALRQIEDQWVAEGFPNTQRVAAITAEVVAQALRASTSA